VPRRPPAATAARLDGGRPLATPLAGWGARACAALRAVPGSVCCVRVVLWRSWRGCCCSGSHGCCC
jgi:hypothetical protein